MAPQLALNRPPMASANGAPPVLSFERLSSAIEVSLTRPGRVSGVSRRAQRRRRDRDQQSGGGSGAGEDGSTQSAAFLGRTLLQTPRQPGQRRPFAVHGLRLRIARRVARPAAVAAPPDCRRKPVSALRLRADQYPFWPPDHGFSTTGASCLKRKRERACGLRAACRPPPPSWANQSTTAAAKSSIVSQATAAAGSAAPAGWRDQLLAGSTGSDKADEHRAAPTARLPPTTDKEYERVPDRILGAHQYLAWATLIPWRDRR